jgi:hypothetical protein
MDNWEFLLQRKGDKSWLPLESSTVEILEGPYRLAARSEFANTMIAIAIAYQPSADTNYHPNQQKISKRVSPDGLLIVMPYTHFTPGNWQISCQMGDVRSPASQKAIVKFDVQAVSAESVSEWQLPELVVLESSAESDTSGTDDQGADDFLGLSEPNQTHLSPATYASPMMAMAEQMSEQLVQSLIDEFSAFDEEFGPDSDEFNSQESETPAPETPPTPVAAADLTSPDSEPPQDLSPSVLLSLNQAQFLVSSETSIAIAGEAYTAGELEITLKNPENLEILVNRSHFVPQSATDSLSSSVFPFQYVVDIPQQARAQVLIGEVKLYPADQSLQDPQAYQLSRAITVTYQSPSLMVDAVKEMDAIATSIANTPPVVESVIKAKPALRPPTRTNSSPSIQLPSLTPTSPVNTVSTPSSIKKTPVSPSSTAVSKSPSLPSLPSPAPSIPVDANPQSDYDEFTELFESELSDTEPENPYPPESDNAEEPDLLYLFEEGLPNNYEQMLVEPPGNAKPSLLESLNIGDRFLSKLQNLSLEGISEKTEADLSAETAESETTTAEATVPISNRLDLSTPTSNLSTPETIEDLNQELERILAPTETGSLQAEKLWEDDSLEVPDQVSPISSELTQPQSLTAPESGTIPNFATTPRNPNVPILGAQEPVPLPIIELPLGELVAGTPIPTRIKLPAIAPQLFVKFWIKDSQTRATIDGPRWLVDFKSESEPEFVEAIMQISIPLGSIEVALEAVAIEVQTQRESHKTRVARSIAPPNIGQGKDLDFEISI